LLDVRRTALTEAAKPLKAISLPEPEKEGVRSEHISSSIEFEARLSAGFELTVSGLIGSEKPIGEEYEMVWGNARHHRFRQASMFYLSDFRHANNFVDLIMSAIHGRVGTQRVKTSMWALDGVIQGSLLVGNAELNIHRNMAGAWWRFG